jgi:hypothetical protein
MPIDRLLRLALPLVLAFTLFMALSPHPPGTPIDRFGDKFQHMTAFAVLAIWARYAYPRASAWRILERLILFGATIEVFQNIPSLHRTCDWHDWLADAIAASIALLVCEALRIFQRRRTRA